MLLRTIDSLWVEHLTEVDDMRRGIGLRGYAQQDPLNEFRREAYRMYEELRGLIRHGVASAIFRVTVQSSHRPTPRRPSPGPGQPPRSPVRHERARVDADCADARAGGCRGRVLGRRTAARSAAAGSAVRDVRESLGRPARRSGRREWRRGVGRRRPGYTPTGGAIGRNDPCWCGSGAKYKKCHGR